MSLTETLDGNGVRDIVDVEAYFQNLIDAGDVNVYSVGINKQRTVMRDKRHMLILRTVGASLEPVERLDCRSHKPYFLEDNKSDVRYHLHVGLDYRCEDYCRLERIASDLDYAEVRKGLVEICGVSVRGLVLPPNSVEASLFIRKGFSGEILLTVNGEDCFIEEVIRHFKSE